MFVGISAGLAAGALWGLVFVVPRMTPGLSSVDLTAGRLVTAAMVCWMAFAQLNAAWLKRHREVSAVAWANWLGIAAGLGAGLLWLVLGSSPRVLLARDDVVLRAHQ
jgi:drug/metabolite transporter (DMT)-like permease